MKPKRPRGRPPHADVLTPAEWRTVYAVQHGMTNAEIARRFT
jgi:DNA-binding NarL/FixJ family response regulator